MGDFFCLFSLPRKGPCSPPFSYRIRNARGVIVRSIAAILRVWVLFYVNLFSASSLSMSDQDFFLNSLDRFLSSEEAALCEGDNTLEECTRALKSFKRNKSPGLMVYHMSFILSSGTSSAQIMFLHLTIVFLKALCPFLKGPV